MSRSSRLWWIVLLVAVAVGAEAVNAQEATVPLEYEVAVRDAQLWETPEATKAVRPLRHKEKLALAGESGRYFRVQARDGAAGFVDAQAVRPTGGTRKKWGTPVFWKFPRRRYLPPDQMSRTELIVGVIYELDGLFFDGVKINEQVLMSKALYSYYQRDFITAACYLALSVDMRLDTYLVGRARFGSRRTYDLLESSDFEVTPPLFRVQVAGRWHRFEIQGTTIRRLD